jgi:hypothetical protein
VNIDEQLEFFFRDCTNPPKDGKVLSNLYVLRRDIFTCFGINPNDIKLELNNKAIWPGVMGIMAGIDLLAKFYEGCDKNGKVRERFKKFLEEYMGISEDNSETIFQLRNSLMHSFGLFQRVKTIEFTDLFYGSRES